MRCKNSSDIRAVAPRQGVWRCAMKHNDSVVANGGGLVRDNNRVQQQKLTPQQELELVKYIEELTACRLPPTRDMIANFALSVATEPVSKSWVTRFISNHSIHLISQYPTGMDMLKSCLKQSS